jgi:hypothetical protein
MRAFLIPAVATLMVLAPVPGACRADRDRLQPLGPLGRHAVAVPLHRQCRAADADPLEQRRAARFFSNPDEAQSVRMSRTRADNEFWARYRSFGAAAERYCRT